MSKHKPPTTTLLTVATGWDDTLLICRKCSKKLRGGFGPDGRDTLRQAARTVLRATGRRGRVGIMEVGCLGVCPKRAVTTARASQPGALQIVPQGYSAEALLA
jgi:predicted metal-binding protein